MHLLHMILANVLVEVAKLAGIDDTFPVRKIRCRLLWREVFRHGITGLAD